MFGLIPFGLGLGLGYGLGAVTHPYYPYPPAYPGPYGAAYRAYPYRGWYPYY